MADWDTAEQGYSAELMARAGASPPATFGQIWDANWKATGLDTLTGSGQPLEDAFNKLVDAASARLGPLPQAARDAGLDWAGARGFEGKARVIQQLAGSLPADQQKEIEPLLDFRARAADTAAAIEKDAGDINGRTYGLSGTATAWLAGVARQMVDPVNVALVAVPGAGEAGLLASVGRQAMIAGLGQAMQEPIIQRNRGELGLEHGLGQAAGDVGNVVAGTAALGLGLPLLFRGAAFLGRKAFARPEELPAMRAPETAAPEAPPQAPIHKVFPHDTTLEAYQSVAPGDLDAAAHVAERDVVAPVRDPARFDDVSTKVEAGEPPLREKADARTAVWANKDHNVPVEIVNEPPQAGPDGRFYQKVRHEDVESYVPADELVPAQAAAPSEAAPPIEAPAERVADLPFPAEEKTAAPREQPPAKPPPEGEAAAPKPLGDPQRAADAERALADAGGDLRITLDDGAGTVREVSARQALAEAEEHAAAARELEQCLGGIAEEEIT
jgi:hypothetical protein